MKLSILFTIIGLLTSYGYADEGRGEVKEKFSESPSATVMLYGLKAGYPINKRMDKGNS